jgi:hypothetical protein
MPIGYPSWSHDGQYIYFDTTLTDDANFFRIRISDRKLERLVSLKGVAPVLGRFRLVDWTCAGRFAAAGSRHQQSGDLRARLAGALGFNSYAICQLFKGSQESSILRALKDVLHLCSTRFETLPFNDLRGKAVSQNRSPFGSRLWELSFGKFSLLATRRHSKFPQRNQTHG